MQSECVDYMSEVTFLSSNAIGTCPSLDMTEPIQHTPNYTWAILNIIIIIFFAIYCNCVERKAAQRTHFVGNRNATLNFFYNWLIIGWLIHCTGDGLTIKRFAPSSKLCLSIIV